MFLKREDCQTTMHFINDYPYPRLCGRTCLVPGQSSAMISLAGLENKSRSTLPSSVNQLQWQWKPLSIIQPSSLNRASVMYTCMEQKPLKKQPMHLCPDGSWMDRTEATQSLQPPLQTEISAMPVMEWGKEWGEKKKTGLDVAAGLLDSVYPIEFIRTSHCIQRALKISQEGT